MLNTVKRTLSTRRDLPQRVSPTRLWLSFAFILTLVAGPAVGNPIAGRHELRRLWG